MRNSHERRSHNGGIVGIWQCNDYPSRYDKIFAMFTALHVRQYARVSRNVEPHIRQIYNVFVSICVIYTGTNRINSRLLNYKVENLK